MEKKNENIQWRRIEAVLQWANMSANYFARHIGLSRGENLYQIKRGNNGISRALAERIVTAFPQVSRAWLLTGDGKMLRSAEDRPIIRYYNANLEAELANVETLHPDGEFDLPFPADAELAMVYHGGAMSPQIPAQSIVLMKKVAPETITPDKEYAVVTPNLVTLRAVRSCENETMWRLTAVNTEEFDDVVVRKTEITAAYAVCGKLIVNQ